MEKEHISVKNMWEAYLHSIGEDSANTNKKYTSWHFCNDEKSADDLAELVKAGIKRGTTSLLKFYEVDNEELPKVYDYNIITDWNGTPQCITRTKKVTALPFKDVNVELAEIQGEGDKSLKYWQDAHIDYFTKELKEINLEFSPDMPVVFEEFEVVF